MIFYKLIFNALNEIKRNLNSFTQTKELSFIKHDSGYSSSNSYLIAKRDTNVRYSEDAANNNEFRLNELILKNPQLGAVAVDIGSGIGWLSGWLSNSFSLVYSIEPSINAINIAKKIHKNKSKKIIWINNFAEDALINLKFNKPVLFVTGRVLSHLRDREVIKIIKAVDNNSINGSVVCFTELWGRKSHQPLWHIRSKHWWEKHFTDKWHLTFLENPVETDERYVGIHGVKVKS
jgi:2-polyprenyl-3-methyl-5-hydroxy-6-metoxy-1,4-benzoquinol methylase